MRKSMMLAAPVVAAMTFVCQPTMAQTAADRAANDADRALNNAGNELNRAANQAGTAADAAATDAADAAQVAGSKQSAMKNMSKDQRFAMKVADMNNFEIQAGQLAAQKAQSEEIKELAQMTVRDHQQAQQRLEQVAQQKNMQFSQELMPVHQAMLTELKQMDGQEFEKAYLYGQVAGHTKAALKLRDAQTELQDKDLRAYASQIYPKIQMHLKHAQQIARADEAITAGARMSGKSGDASHDAGHGQGGSGVGPSGAGDQGTSGKPAGGATGTGAETGSNQQ